MSTRIHKLEDERTKLEQRIWDHGKLQGESIRQLEQANSLDRIDEEIRKEPVERLMAVDLRMCRGRRAGAAVRGHGRPPP